MEETLNAMQEVLTWHVASGLSRQGWTAARQKAGGEGDDTGWAGRMASPTWWTWVWVDSRSWWWKGRPGVLQSTESKRVRHDRATELEARVPVPACAKAHISTCCRNSTFLALLDGSRTSRNCSDRNSPVQGTGLIRIKTVWCHKN